MKLFLGIVPPPSDAERIDALRRRYPGRLVGHVDPHVTLVPPFEEEQASGLSDAIERALRNAAAPCVGLGEPGFFDDRVLYFRVIDSEGGLPLLRREIFGALRDFRRDAGGRGLVGTDENGPGARVFHPHLTLAMRSFGTPVWAMAQMYAEASVLAPSFAPFSASCVRVFARRDEGWRRYADLPVGPG